MSEIDRLGDFLRAARGCSQEQVIIEFLETAVSLHPSSDCGSVLIKHPARNALILFNANDFLFEKKLLDPNVVASWPSELQLRGTIAGLCFRTKSTKIFRKEDASTKNGLFGNSPIQNMVCIPIMTGGEWPFGIVCFHNNVPEKEFSDAEVEALESCVDVLAIALHTPLPELNLEKNVFIVHGRDEEALKDLQLLLFKYHVTPKVLVNTNRGPNSILDELEALIRICRAGFILMTPDDEGRLRGKPEDPLIPRARENVVFETGLLFAKFRKFERVILLLKEPTQLPSDLSGISYEKYIQSVTEIESRLAASLEDWGLAPSIRPSGS
ncbi:MAG: TIR domain-containing protein [Rhodoplanes sp.]